MFLHGALIDTMLIPVNDLEYFYIYSYAERQ